MNPTLEKRKYPRRNVTLPVIYEYKNRTFRENTKDVSEGGMFLIADRNIEIGSRILLSFSLPKLAKPINVTSRVVRVNKMYFTQGQCIPKGLGLEFENITSEYKKAIGHFVEDPRLKPLPEFRIHYEPRFCHLNVADLSIGCEYSCIYCHFSRLNRRKYLGYGTDPIPVDITSICTIKEFPETLYLSPSSEAFSNITKELTHELLTYMLPKGVNFVIVTKGILPEKTLKLIEKYKTQFEGITIGITNLDPKRNFILEPNAPSSEERLRQIPELLKTGVRIGIRMDPIFPNIDDTDLNLSQMAQVTSELGVDFITATYIFSFGEFLVSLKKEPYLKDSVAYIIEKSSLQGGLAYTVPFEMKLKTYEKLFNLCNSYGIEFNTCGCKEERLKELIDKLGYSIICRNKKFYQNNIR